MLIETAINSQLKTLKQGIQLTQERIAEFEKCAGMSSAEFEAKLQKNEIDETIETIDWNMELAALRLLEGQYRSLRETKID
jgi:hypothetical protein